MSTLPLPLFPTSLSWGDKWTPVPNDSFTPQELKTDVGLAAAAVQFSDDPHGRGIGYTYQIALALVNQQGQVFVNLLPLYPIPGNWTKWIDISGEFQSANVALSAVAIGKKLYLYAVGVDTHVYFNWTDGQSWNGWAPVSGVEKTKTAVSAASDGTLYLVGLHGGIWANPHPTTPDGEWKLVPPVVQPVFLTDAGVCVSVGNSRSSAQNGTASFDLLRFDHDEGHGRVHDDEQTFLHRADSTHSADTGHHADLVWSLVLRCVERADAVVLRDHQSASPVGRIAE